MKYFLSIILGLTLFIAQGATASADVNDFVINDFSAQYVLDNDEVGGSLQAKETIKLTFSDNNHGIFRAIPMNYQGFDTKLEVASVKRDGVAEKYTKSSQNGNQVLKIGDPDRTITGQHTYEIDYNLVRPINFKEGQQFYWDVNGNQWGQTFEKVSASVALKNKNLIDTSPVCFTGVQGSSAKNCVISEDGKSVNFATTRPLGPYENMTVGVNINGVAFVQPTWKDTLADNALNIAGLVFGLAIAISGVFIWIKRGKDYSGRGTVVPEYEPPKDLSPGEVGLLADYKVDTKDLSATLIDLAVRGYIKLHEETKKVFFFKSKEYSAELLIVDTKSLKSHELLLLQAIFETYSTGQIVAFSDLNVTTMSTAVKKIRKTLKDDLSSTYGLIETKSQSNATWMAVAGMILLFGAFFIGIFLGWGFGAGSGIAGLTFLLLSFVMPRRSHAGVETYEKIMGLKLYMNVAEKDRMQKMQSVDRPYAEPTKTPELFEKLLPYAVALGVEKSWAKQFDGILTDKPGWYDSNSTGAFSGAYLASSIAGFSSGFSSSFESSSGASGGSSGGGGGGGGGGGW